MIKQASEEDILTIEDILLDVVLWMKKNGLENQWNEESIRWCSLSKDYKINEFYIYYENQVPAGCMAITDLDRKYWPEIARGRSLYLHKLAIKREFAGKEASKALINFAKNLSLERGCSSLRLDCNSKRDKLRGLYENQGFIYEDKKNVKENYDMALYVWKK